MRILVTGAGGYVGSLLVPRLHSEGHEVRGLARDPRRVKLPVEVLRGDALSGEGLAAALSGVEVAYYLIHSMERSNAPTGAFAERDRLAARTFAGRAAAAGVRRIVYLGGPEPGVDGSQHLRSRAEVERVLLTAIPDSIALRASIVIGAGSRSFRLLVRLVERMRVLALPAWRRYRTRPIDERDVLELLVAAAGAPAGGASLEAVGPDVLSFQEIVERIAELMLVHRPSLGFGLSATGLTGRVAAAIAGEDPELVVPLMGSLRRDLLPTGPRADERLGVHLHSFDSAVEHALREWEEHESLAAR